MSTNDNVIPFPVDSHPASEDDNNEFPISADQVLSYAIERGLRNVILVGRTNDDDSLYFASTTNNVGKILIYLEKAKAIALDAIPDD